MSVANCTFETLTFCVEFYPEVSHSHSRRHFPLETPLPSLLCPNLKDRAWLEKVVSEGVRDDFAAMTNIYMRLCAYLDRAATRTSTTATANPSAPMGETAPIAPPATTPSGSASLPTPPPAIPQASSGSGTVSIGGALSTFVAPPVVAVPAEVTYEGGVVGDGGMDGEEGVDGIMNDLEVRENTMWQ